MATIRRVVRVLVYEGTPEWVAETLKPIAVPDGTIRHFSRTGLIRSTRVEDVLMTTNEVGEITIITFIEPRR